MRKLGRTGSRTSRAAGRTGSGLPAAFALTAFLIVAPAGTTLAAASASPSAHPPWRIRSSPNATVPGGQLDSVSCSSPNACTAVGTSLGPSGLNVTLAERWNGTSWQLQRPQNPPANVVPASMPDLTGVSCPTAGSCEAVGSYQVSTVGISLAEGWNGRAWTLQRVPVPTGSTYAFLNKVSCASARFCEAVGSYGITAGARLAFAAQWNGTSWHVQRMRNPLGGTLVSVTGVSCVSATFCEAGGFAADTGSFAERWDGTSWHLQAVPGTAGVGALSCVSTSFCETVGIGGGDMWNGSSWSAQTIPSPAGATFASLLGVSCRTATSCQAVGQYNDNSGTTFGFGASWNGTSWSVLTTPDVARASFTSLGAVSCAAVAACEAVGRFFLGTDNPVALAESWNGTSWSAQRAVTPPGAAANVLNAVSCTSVAFCEAVGSHQDRSRLASVALAERWNGARWTIQRAANPANTTNGLRMILNGVSCVSARFCEAVGSSSAAGGGGAEVWNGTSWALQAVPAGNLTSVSCVTAHFCVAAGGDGHVDLWNGTSWSARATAAGFTSLGSVSCASPRFCEAVGSGPSGKLAERWNGTSWSAQAIATPAGGSSAGLSAVSCSGLTSCAAVGSYFNSAFQQVTLAEAWNGQAWKVQPTPNPAASLGSSLLGVWCASATSCAAVGQYSVSVPTLTLAEVWNGTAWRLRSTPSHPFAGQNTFDGVSCGVSGGCTAVGVTTDLGQIPATLIETGD